MFLSVHVRFKLCALVAIFYTSQILHHVILHPCVHRLGLALHAESILKPASETENAESSDRGDEDQADESDQDREHSADQ